MLAFFISRMYSVKFINSCCYTVGSGASAAALRLWRFFFSPGRPPAAGVALPAADVAALGSDSGFVCPPPLTTPLDAGAGAGLAGLGASLVSTRFSAGGCWSAVAFPEAAAAAVAAALAGWNALGGGGGALPAADAAALACEAANPGPLPSGGRG